MAPSARQPSASPRLPGRVVGDSYEVCGTPPEPPAPRASPCRCCSLGAFPGQMQLVPRPGMAAAHAWHRQPPHRDGSLPSITTASRRHPGVLSPAPLGTTPTGGVGCVCVGCPVQLQGGLHPTPLPCAHPMAGLGCWGWCRGVLWRGVPLGNTVPTAQCINQAPSQGGDPAGGDWGCPWMCPQLLGRGLVGFRGWGAGGEAGKPPHVQSLSFRAWGGQGVLEGDRERVMGYGGVAG